MLRNREFRALFLTVSAVALGLTVVSALIAPFAGIAAGTASVLIIGLIVLNTRRRYAEIARLSAYLARINGGDDALDVRDNTEGELSILKSEIYKVTVTLRQQNEALRHDKTALADALSDISHQLKTPLTSMFMMTDLLSDPDLPEEQRHTFTERIRVQLERLQWLVSSLLKLSKLDAGTARLAPREVEAGKLVGRACEPLRILMELKDQTLHVSGGQTVIRCDEPWTAEALLNILKNCVEYTPEHGEITVVCEDNPLFSQIRVEDTGPGIDPTDLPHIFKRFYRGKNASDDSVGIGLAMAAAIVEEQGGTVEARSRSGGGSVFTLRLPK